MDDILLLLKHNRDLLCINPNAEGAMLNKQATQFVNNLRICCAKIFPYAPVEIKAGLPGNHIF